jgi:hypothetical protein
VFANGHVPAIIKLANFNGENSRVKTNRLRSISALLLCVTTLAFSNAAAFAATIKNSTPAGTNSQELRVSPVKTDITVPAGTTGTVNVIVSNLTNNTITLQPVENDFIASGEQGQAALILSPDSYAPTHSLKRFMVPLSDITLPPKGGQSVSVHITVPKNAQAGGYFGALRFSPLTASASSGTSSVALGESVASLILMTVPGPTYEQLTLTNFDIEQNGSTSSNFRTPNNLSLLVRFENQGNLQESPFGQIDVQKGKKVLYTYNFNQTQPQEEILPDSYRRWNIPIKGMGKFGKYTVSATFTYGTKGNTIDVVKTIWIIPSTYIIAGVITIVALIVIIGGLILFLKSYKRRILKSSRRRY